MARKSPELRDQVVFMSILRLFGAVVFLVVAAIMAFGFLASFEEAGITRWKIGYGSASVLFFLVFVVLLSGAIRGFHSVSR